MYDELVQPVRLGAALVEATGDDRWRDPAVELIRGGKSNLTFWVRSDAGELVLRRPPSGNLLPTGQRRAPPDRPRDGGGGVWRQ